MGRLQTARLENFIRRWGSIKGFGSVLSETLGDVFPVLDLENLTPENQLVAGWHPFHIFSTVIGAAGKLGSISCQNPANSGAIVVVDKMIINAVVGQPITAGLRAPFPTVIATRARDSRDRPLTGGLAQMGAINDTGALFGMIIRVVAGVDREVEVPNGLAVLSPNNAFAVVMSTVTESMTVNFIGRARLAEPSELSF